MDDLTKYDKILEDLSITVGTITGAPSSDSMIELMRAMNKEMFEGPIAIGKSTPLTLEGLSETIKSMDGAVMAPSTVVGSPSMLKVYEELLKSGVVTPKEVRSILDSPDAIFEPEFLKELKEL